MQQALRHCNIGLKNFNELWEIRFIFFLQDEENKGGVQTCRRVYVVLGCWLTRFFVIWRSRTWFTLTFERKEKLHWN